MTKRIMRNKDFLRNVSRSKSFRRKVLIKKATKDNIDALSEVALNTLLGNVPLTGQHKQKLRRYRFKIRNLAKKFSLKKKKDFLIQKGGFLPLLVTPILSILGGLAANAITHLAGL